MRFSASTTNLGFMEHFKAASLVISNLSEFVIFKILNDCMYIIADPTYHNFISGASCRLSKDLFKEYKFSGLNAANNQIVFSVRNGSFLSCFAKVKYNEPIKCMKFRLVNLDNNFGFCILYKLPAALGSKIYSETLHIRLLQPSEWQKHDEASMDNVKISFFMPPFKDFQRTIREQAKVSDKAIFAAKITNHSASFRTESMSCDFSIEMRWDELEVCRLVFVNANRVEDRNRWFLKKVPTREIQKLFKTFVTFKPTQVSCTLDETQIIFHFFHDIGCIKVHLNYPDED